MRAYTVHAPRTDPEPDRFVFVKDGFSWPALFIPLFWILWHRMWLTLLGYLIFVALVATIRHAGADMAATWIGIGGLLVFGFEGNNMRRLSLERRHFEEVGSASGRNLAEAEIRFFGAWNDASHEGPGRAFAGGTGTATSEEPILGLFPEPEH